MSEAPYVLHVWPSKWGLQSLDPTCLAAVMYLQLTIPGKFKVAPCTNPDESPNGHLPFLTHGHNVLSTFPSIVAFVASLAKSNVGATDLDASLTSAEKAQRTAWYAHIEGSISDLVSHMFYGIDANFWGLTNPALASEMPVPLKYYVPGRIRDSYKPRLEAVGLWSLPSVQQEQKNPSPFAKEEKKKVDHKVTFARAFEREKILEKARTVLGIHARSLDGKLFYFGDRLTSLDVYLASHILLLADPPFTDSVLQALLLETYPGLVDHARRVQNEVARAPPYEYAEVSRSFRSLIPRPFLQSGTQGSAEDIRYRNMTLAFVAAAGAAVVVYYYTVVLKLMKLEPDLEASEESESESGEDREIGEGGEEEEVAVGDSEEAENEG